MTESGTGPTPSWPLPDTSPFQAADRPPGEKLEMGLHQATGAVSSAPAKSPPCSSSSSPSRPTATDLLLELRGQTELHRVCADPDLPLEEVLKSVTGMVSARPSITEAMNILGRTPLMYAAMRLCSGVFSSLDEGDAGSMQEVVHALENGPIMPSPKSDGPADSTMLSLVQYLLGHMGTGSVEEVDEDGLSALDHSVSGYRREPAVAALLFRTCVSQGGSQNRPSLVRRALMWGNVALVRWLNEKEGLTPQLESPEGKAILYDVLSARKSDLLRLSPKAASGAVSVGGPKAGDGPEEKDVDTAPAMTAKSSSSFKADAKRPLPASEAGHGGTVSDACEAPEGSTWSSGKAPSHPVPSPVAPPAFPPSLTAAYNADASDGPPQQDASVMGGPAPEPSPAVPVEATAGIGGSEPAPSYSDSSEERGKADAALSEPPSSLGSAADAGMGAVPREPPSDKFEAAGSSSTLAGPPSEPTAGWIIGHPPVTTIGPWALDAPPLGPLSSLSLDLAGPAPPSAVAASAASLPIAPPTASSSFQPMLLDAIGQGSMTVSSDSAAPVSASPSTSLEALTSAVAPVAVSAPSRPIRRDPRLQHMTRAPEPTGLAFTPEQAGLPPASLQPQPVPTPDSDRHGSTPVLSPSPFPSTGTGVSAALAMDTATASPTAAAVGPSLTSSPWGPSPSPSEAPVPPLVAQHMAQYQQQAAAAFALGLDPNAFFLHQQQQLLLLQAQRQASAPPMAPSASAILRPAATTTAGKPERSLVIASVILSLLVTKEGHRLMHRGLEALVQQHLPDSPITSTEFREAMRLLEATNVVMMEPDKALEMVVLKVPVHHTTAVGLAVIHLLLIDASRFIRWANGTSQDDLLHRLLVAMPRASWPAVTESVGKIRETLKGAGLLEEAPGNGEWVRLKRTDLCYRPVLTLLGADTAQVDKPVASLPLPSSSTDTELEKRKRAIDPFEPPSLTTSSDRQDDKRPRRGDDGHRHHSEERRGDRSYSPRYSRGRSREEDRHRRRRSPNSSEDDKMRGRGDHSGRGSGSRHGDRERDRSREKPREPEGIPDRWRADSPPHPLHRHPPSSSTRKRDPAPTPKESRDRDRERDFSPPRPRSRSRSPPRYRSPYRERGMDHRRDGPSASDLPPPSDRYADLPDPYTSRLEREVARLKDDLDEVLRDRDHLRARLRDEEARGRQAEEAEKASRKVYERNRVVEKELERLRDVERSRDGRIRDLERELDRVMEYERRSSRAQDDRIAELEHEVRRLRSMGPSSHAPEADEAEVRELKSANRYYADKARTLEYEVSRFRDLERQWQQDKETLDQTKERLSQCEVSLGDAQPRLAGYERILRAAGGKGVEEVLRMLEQVPQLTVRQHQLQQQLQQQQQLLLHHGRAPPSGGGMDGQSHERVALLEAQLEKLRDEATDMVHEYNSLSSLHFAVTAELNEARRMLLAVAEKHPGSLPTKWFCRASDEEIKQALAQHMPAEQVTAAVLYRAGKMVDEYLRNPGFDPFVRRNGSISDVDPENAMLKKVVAKYGEPLGKLLLQKRTEVEKYCPSGHYPVLELWSEGENLSVPKALKALLTHVKLEI